MKLRPVLVQPMYAGNVGAVVRVTANLGIEELVVVRPACPLESTDFLRMAMGGQQHVRVSVVSSLDEAVRDVDAVVATTSGRERDPRQLVSPEQALERLGAAGASLVAVVLGRERGGLTRPELARGHLLLTVPTNPAFPTLSVAQAAAIVLAAFQAGVHQPQAPTDPQDHPAPAQDFEAALEHLRRALLGTGFLDPANPARIHDQLRRWLGRAIPTRRELAILRGIAAHVEYLARQSRGREQE